ncbi:MAG: NAD(P)/FAD-dependent oxidoreductase [Candidatus Thermoplasmatota archaeon]|nr:NAD(P)/FAD-dependent oxidoreductase [Candidatus Thermoplasmatota archaeon]
MQGHNFEIAVIGGGPSGISAAIQATRFGLNVALFEREKLGGLIRCANLIENFPGFYGKTGAEAAQLLSQQAKSIGVNSIFENVLKISKTQNGAFVLETADGEYTSDAVIVATGTKQRKIAIPGLPEGAVRYWTEEPREFSGKDVLVLGGGEAALDQAIRISKFSKSIKIICRSKVKAIPILLDRCAAAGIKIHEDTETIGGEIADGRITIRTSAGGFQRSNVGALKSAHPTTSPRCADFSCDEIAVFCGREPENGILPQQIRSLENPSVETKIPGLYLAGDLIAGRRRQLAIAIGTGMDAALHAVEYVSAKKEEKV